MIDWNEAWKAARVGHVDHDAAYWDRKAPRYVVSSGSDYVQGFLQRAGVRPGESVLDMGCGSGTLALPLAADGHQVVAVDFSAGMLGKLEERARAQGVSGIRTIEGSWDDDWEALGVPRVDVALASRSAATDDLRAAFTKLDDAARRRVCITLSGSDSPRYDQRVHDALGRHGDTLPMFVYGFGILVQMGIFPDVSYLVSWKDVAYPTWDELRADIEEPLGAITTTEREALDAFYREHVVHTVAEDGAESWARDYPQPVRWAFISWDHADRD